MSNTEDTYIIDLFWERNEDAVKLTEEKYHGLCYQVAWKILTNREDSEECVNDTWLAAWKYIPPKRPVRLSAFLAKITRGFAMSVMRKKYAAKRADTHLADISGEVEELNVAVSGRLEEHMEEEELLAIINHFLEKLPARSRDIFIRRYWMMDSLKEISGRHGMSEGAVKQNLLRTKRKLKKELEKEGRL